MSALSQCFPQALNNWIQLWAGCTALRPGTWQKLHFNWHAWWGCPEAPHGTNTGGGELGPQAHKLFLLLPQFRGRLWQGRRRGSGDVMHFVLWGHTLTALDQYNRVIHFPNNMLYVNAWCVCTKHTQKKARKYYKTDNEQIPVLMRVTV